MLFSQQQQKDVYSNVMLLVEREKWEGRVFYATFKSFLTLAELSTSLRAWRIITVTTANL